MSFRDFDVVVWGTIFGHMRDYEIEALVNAFPDLEGFVKKLAYNLMKTHCPKLYSGTDDYLRWKNRKGTHEMTFIGCSNPATIELVSVASSPSCEHSRNARTALCAGLAPPPGTDICIVFAQFNSKTPITVWLNIEDAIKYYLDNIWAASADDVFDCYNDSLPDHQKHNQYISMKDEGMNEWLSNEYPVVQIPFTKKNVAKHILANKYVFDLYHSCGVHFIHMRTEEYMYI
jgi:hypothetical protein